MPTEVAQESSVEKMVNQLKLQDRVLIEWVDAHSLPLEGWISLDFIETVEIDCLVRSLGYFLCRKNDFLVLAMDIMHPKSSNYEDEYNSASAIPVACIKSIEVIGHG